MLPGSTVDDKRDFLRTMSLAALAASAADCASIAFAHTAVRTCTVRAHRETGEGKRVRGREGGKKGRGEGGTEGEREGGRDAGRDGGNERWKDCWL